MFVFAVSPQECRSTPRPDSQLLPHSRPGRARQVGLLLDKLPRRTRDSAGVPRPLALQVVFPPPPPPVVTIAVFVSGRNRAAGVALDPN